MSVADTQLVQVRNLVDHSVVFKDEDTHRRIVFNPFETKKIEADMLRRLNYSHGGNVLLTNYLCVENDELAREFGVSPETIEYKWTKKDVDDLLISGSVDRLLDALDFAPEGIVDLIISRARQLKINDMAKRKAIEENTGFSINSMITFEEQAGYDEGQEEKQGQRQQRRVPSENSNAGGRRVSVAN